MSETEPKFSLPPNARDFRTTHWTVVLQAGGADGEHALAALEKLCRTYWYPVYGFIRQRGHDAEAAQDLTQEFFARLLAKNYLRTADANKGRFRTFLLTAVTRFLANEWDRTQTLKRGGGHTIVSLDETDAEGRYLNEPICALTPENAFDQKWAGEVLATVLERLREEFDGAGRAGRFDALKVFLVEDKGTATYAEVAARLGTTESGVKSGIHRLRQRYGELIREEVAHTVDSPDQVEEELGHLLAALSD